MPGRVATSRERQQRVHDLVLHRREVKASDIAMQLSIFLATVRRDLAALERRGLIERTWGGAKVRSPINVATGLYNHDLTKVVVTGGALNSYSYELVGDMVGYTLQKYRLDLCFVGCSGVTPDSGFSMRDTSESAIARAFLSASERAVVIADHAKVGQKTFANFAPLSAAEGLISDEGLGERWRGRLKEAGLAVDLAPGLALEDTG